MIDATVVILQHRLPSPTDCDVIHLGPNQVCTVLILVTYVTPNQHLMASYYHDVRPRRVILGLTATLFITLMVTYTCNYHSTVVVDVRKWAAPVQGRHGPSSQLRYQL